MNKRTLITKVAGAKREIVAAEERLSKALSETRGGLRAEKTTSTQAVQDAISSLRKARVDLEELEKLVAGDGT